MNSIITPWGKNTDYACMAQISIIIPVYNSELYLEDCIKSILNQSYEDFEAIFIDDGSLDASFAIINEYVHCDNRIKLYHQNNAKRHSQEQCCLPRHHPHLCRVYL